MTVAPKDLHGELCRRRSSTIVSTILVSLHMFDGGNDTDFKNCVVRKMATALPIGYRLEVLLILHGLSALEKRDLRGTVHSEGGSKREDPIDERVNHSAAANVMSFGRSIVHRAGRNAV